MSFFDKVYAVVKTIPKGKVVSYGTVARLCGNAKMSRQVGWALHGNPDNTTIPCHRVVTKNGECSKAFAFGGANTQRQMLEQEGILFVNDCVDMDRCSVAKL